MKRRRALIYSTTGSVQGHRGQVHAQELETCMCVECQCAVFPNAGRARGLRLEEWIEGSGKTDNYDGRLPLTELSFEKDRSPSLLFWYFQDTVRQDQNVV